MIPNKISLIGMPSAGKSTTTRELAQRLGYKVIDLDLIVEEKEGQSLIEILEKKGGKYFLDIENSFLQSLFPEEKVVISTAGSIIYHNEAMHWLKSNSKICLIDTEFSVIEKRLLEKPKAVVGLKEKGLQTLWQERMPVYKKWADISVATEDKSSSQVVDEIISKLS